MARIVIHTGGKKIIINKRHHSESPPIIREKGGLHTGIYPNENHTPTHDPGATTHTSLIEEVLTGPDHGPPPTASSHTIAKGISSLTQV